MSERAEQAERVGHVAEELKTYWLLLVEHEKSFATGDDAKLYALAGECFKQLWEAGVECTYATGWKDVAVWHKIEFSKPGEAERRIRQQVRPRLQQARKLAYQRWWVPDGVDAMGEYVDRWFGGEETQAAKLQREAGQRKETEAAKRAGSGDKLRNMLDELRGLVEKYAKS
jgi:hypothetical protein